MAREAEGDVVLITGKDDTSQFHFCFPPMFYIKNAHEKSRESEDFFFFLVCFTRMENQFFSLARNWFFDIDISNSNREFSFERIFSPSIKRL